MLNHLGYIGLQQFTTPTRIGLFPEQYSSLLIQYELQSLTEPCHLPSHRFPAVFGVSSTEFSASSISPAGTAPAPGIPASRRLLILTLPRLRTRGSPMSSFSDSARCRCPLVSPADVRLNMARRPRSEAERVGGVSLMVCELRCCGGESCSR